MNTPITVSGPGERMDIPMNNGNTADHNGDMESREDMKPGKNPVGNKCDTEGEENNQY